MPPTELLPARSHRAVPYLHSDKDVVALMVAAQILSFPLRVLTYQTMIGLVAVTGMRIGEAIWLDRRDLDFENGVLTVRLSKFGNCRCSLPRSMPSTPISGGETICIPGQSHSACSSPRRAPGCCTATCTGHSSAWCVTLVSGRGRRLVDPRLHDLRHSFAVRTVMDAYRADADVAARLPLLSTYLGHMHPGNTYWYLSAAPELLAFAGRRPERSLEAPS